MIQHDFQFFYKYNDFFLQKNRSDKIFPFHIYFSHLWKNLNQKTKLAITCVFECFQSHGHILKELHEFFVYDGCHNHFWKKIVSYLILWIMDCWQSHLGLGAHLKRRWRKQNVKRWMWIFNNQIRMNHLT